MAGEWIKIESITPDKPEVIRLTRILNAGRELSLKLDRDLILGKLVRLWSWFDRVSVDGVVDGVVSTDVDDLVRLPGFIDALKVVGWIDFDDEKERVWIPNFDEHNGDSAKKRAQKSRRQARWRAGPDDAGDELPDVDGAASTGASTREEKRREKKSRGDSNLVTPKKPRARKGEYTIPDDWHPSLKTVSELNAETLHNDFFLGMLLKEFRLYWRERGDLRGDKAWETTFKQFVIDRWNYLGKPATGGQGSIP